MSPEHCDKVLLLQAEFDGELDAAAAAEIAEHRALCPICRASWAELRRVREAVRETASYHSAPASLRAAVTARLAAAAAEPGLRRLVRWWREALSGVAGAALAAAILLALWPSGRQGLVEAIVDDHVRALQPGHLVDVASSNRHTVKPWFAGRLDFAPPVKDLAAEGYPLLGGRLDYLGGRAVAALAYVHGGHRIDLFVWPQAGGEEAPQTAERHGYNIVHWRQDGMALWAVSDLEPDLLRAFVRDWRAPSK
ncbi:MAG TPA: anti-sigma factor [Stellaceae bacterium]|nr:anti-sigma factor [Stellaceae bacterium]